MEEATRLILAGKVSTDGRRIDKPGEQLKPDTALRVRAGRRFASRGGLKLEAALEAFGIDVEGRTVLDAGCSTGGFTDCLIRRGAVRVYAVDVGYGVLDWSLRSDQRVDVRERTNVRALCREDFPVLPEVLVADLSFVSLTRVLPGLLELLSPGWQAAVLVKPQFEVAGLETDRGIVRDPALRRRAVEEVALCAREAGATVLGEVESPIRGADGNVEYLLGLGAPGEA